MLPELERTRRGSLSGDPVCGSDCEETILWRPSGFTDDPLGGNLLVSTESRPRGDAASLGRRSRLAAKAGAAAGRDGSGAVGGDGVAERKSGTLRVACKSGTGTGATAFRVIEPVSSLGNCLGVSFAKLGDGSLDTGNGASLPGSGEDAGDTGETKVASIGVF